MANKDHIDKFINYSAVSKLLTGNRTVIRAGYNGHKFAAPIEQLRTLILTWKQTINGQIQKN